MNKIIYKTPKGTQDFDNGYQALRQELVNICIKQFKLYGTKFIDTPAFEREDVLMEKYSTENEKEIFKIVTEGDTEDAESLAMRYDLTVPFSRYVKTKGIKKIKRGQIGKVWRRDQPNMKAGRFREFLQADYDCADSKCEMELADAETLALMISTLDNITEIPYTIRLNDRNILYSMLEYCKVPVSMYPTVCSTIDKMDKKKWKALVPDLVTKGLDNYIIETLGSVLKEYKNITWDNLSDVPFVPSDRLTYLNTMYEYLKILSPNPSKMIKLDFTLARGLDYYTGIIFEVVTKKKIGSIAGGGRYDNLCEVPCVGFSIGIDRILSVLKPSRKRLFNPTVWVTQIDGESEAMNRDLYKYRLKVVSELRKEGIATGTELRSDTGIGPQMKYVLKNEIPYVIFVGPDEMTSNVVTIKDMDARKQFESIPLNAAIERINN